MRNNFYVTIDGIRVHNAVFPLKYGDFLDEQLDYAMLTLARDEKEFYEPLTPVEILIRSNGTNGTQEITKRYLIANDNAIESPNGLGLYKHDLMLIEETKFLEGFMVESLCVTNAGGRIYQVPKIASMTVEENSGTDKANFDAPELITPQKPYTEIILPAAKKVTGLLFGDLNGMNTITRFFDSNSHIIVNSSKNVESYKVGELGEESYTIALEPGINTIHYELSWTYSNSVSQIPLISQGKLEFFFDLAAISQKLPLKPWTIKEVIDRVLELSEPLLWDTEKQDYVKKPRFHFDYATRKKTTQTVTVKTSLLLSGHTTVSFTAGMIVNIKATKDFIGSVYVSVDRTSYTVTVTAGPNREYTVEVEIDYVDYEEYDLYDQLSPEFTFTRGMLREVLQEIGGFIHAEPRLTGNVITYDRYGGRELAKYFDIFKKEILPLNGYKYIGKQVSYGIEKACTRIDSYVDNLINQLSEANATVYQPYEEGYQSLRTDSAYMRIEENESTVFPSAYPISKVKKFFWVDVDGKAGRAGTKYDITPYLYETSIYNSQLSSYTIVYPSSKCFGLYYTQGEKNIGGFFFKVPNAIGEVYENYSIVNILRAVTGKNDLEFETTEYVGICFELVYIPVYSARVVHGKQYIGELLKYPRSIAHNQSSNQVETQYYGENIKGLAERTGNAEKSYTFRALNVETLPKAGQLWDDDYYISSVEVEVNFDGFRCTAGLSKNFNRVSQYIGANSYRRLYEVSERMVQERQSIYTDYVVISDIGTDPGVVNDVWCNTYLFFNNLASEFLQEYYEETYKNRISAVIIQGHTKNGSEQLPNIMLPVISSAFGNVMEFSWEFKDNFSAGMQALKVSGDVSGTFGQEVQYCDYYGRMYYETISLQKTSSDFLKPDELPELEYEIAGYRLLQIITTPDNCYLVKRKDSREALKENYAVEFVTDVKGMIIGSGLAANNPLVIGENEKAKALLVVLKKSINKFSRLVDLSEENISGQYELSSEMINGGAQDSNFNHYAEGKGIVSGVEGGAWAYVTPVYEGEAYEVEDENGNVSTITPKFGGELLLGRNIDISVGDTIGAFRAFAVHDIFEYLKIKQGAKK